MDDGFFDYLESNILANTPLPEGVNFVLASIPKLFGTELGTFVCQVAEQRGWPVVWTLGAR